MTNITYTFPADCAIPDLRGKTVTGGYIDGELVRFATRIDGRAVAAKIAGKPELEAALAAQMAAEAAKAAILTAIGWSAYAPVEAVAMAAREAYERASEHGYPAREAALQRAAYAALHAVARELPGAAAYALAVEHSRARNDAKAAAGKRAIAAIEAGTDPGAAVKAMRTEWRAEAARAVENS